ncbi:hypothetical protein E2562_029510 [Oryza meyeriana var. granulata]|uniref:Uncharacterized protein n=1 Tax=Oryza meyeriana var. granulata TaxID=110450 RepID=A0A6G1FDU5_9ORYZ|nr:hypothetical protein E2562_029510 [Oryza meyeriana var. granulata]
MSFHASLRNSVTQSLEHRAVLPSGSLARLQAAGHPHWLFPMSLFMMNLYVTFMKLADRER